VQTLGQVEETGRAASRCGGRWRRLPPPRRRLLAAVAAGSLLLSALPAGAAPPCGVTVQGALSFGSYDVFSPAPLTSTARIQLGCPPGRNPQVTISRGNSATYVWRELRSGADVLRYNVYQDAALTIVWGDGTDGSRAYVAPRGNAQLVLYGVVPAGQDTTPGTYTDALLVTVFL
jgi:spore coat protein U-like protein